VPKCCDDGGDRLGVIHRVNGEGPLRMA
jgi:hypothetical protein